MIKATISIISVLISASAFASGSIVKVDSGRLVGVMDFETSSGDSTRFYNALNLDLQSDMTGTSKNFGTKDYVVSMSCMNLGTPVCGFSIAMNGSAETPVVVEDGVMMTYMNDPETAKNFYNALALDEHEGRSGYAKVFKTTDEAIEVYCTKSKIPVGTQYACTISIKMPNP